MYCSWPNHYEHPSKEIRKERNQVTTPCHRTTLDTNTLVEKNYKF